MKIIKEFLNTLKVNKLGKQGFTLVELIIVIAIISVLAVAAFMMLTKWLGKSRDARRLTDLDVIHKSLEIGLVDSDNTSYGVPIPDNYREVTINGTIWYQGIVGTGVISNIDSLTRKPVDPNGQDYVYSLMKSNKRIYQIATVLEGDTAFLTNTAIAIDGTNRIEGTFAPALFNIELTGSNCGILYLPSIVVANGVEEISLGGNDQYFVLDGDSNNLLYGGNTMKTYKDILGVEKNIDVVWSGNCNTDLSDENIISSITNNLSGMVTEDVSNSYVIKLLEKGGTDIYSSSSNSSNSEGFSSSFITSSFWDDFDINNETQKNNLKKIFDTNSKYTQNWTGYSECNIDNIELFTGTTTHSLSLNSNTIYILDSSSITVDYGVQFNGNNCIALISKTSGGTELKDWRNNNIISDGFISIGSNRENIIIDNINEYGNKTQNNYLFGINIKDSKNITLNNINTYDNDNHGIKLSSSSNLYLNNVKSYDNGTHGIYLAYINNSVFKNIEAYGNNSGASADYNGLFLNGSSYNSFENINIHNNKGVLLLNDSNYNTFDSGNIHNNTNSGLEIKNNTSYNNFKNMRIYDNTEDGIEIYSDNNSFSNLEIYNNNDNGIDISGCSGNNLSNIKSYNNAGIGIDIFGDNNYLNNIQLFNNTEGGFQTSSSNYISLNNIQAYNNGGNHAVKLISTNYATLNNLQIYNNNIGIYFHSDSNTNTNLNNIEIYDNNRGMYQNSDVGTEYYGFMKLFNNTTNNFLGTPPTAGTGHSIFSDGILDETIATMTCNYHSQPNLVTSWGTDCIDKGVKTTGLTTPVTNYSYGGSILNQIQPVKRNGTNLELYGTNGSEYNTSKKIGEW